MYKEASSNKKEAVLGGELELAPYAPHPRQEAFHRKLLGGVHGLSDCVFTQPEPHTPKETANNYPFFFSRQSARCAKHAATSASWTASSRRDCLGPANGPIQPWFIQTV